MKKINNILKIIISFILILCMISGTSAFAVEQIYFKNIADESNKISDELQKIITENINDSVSVYVFLKKSDRSQVDSILKNKYNRDVNAYNDQEVYYDKIVPNLIVNGKSIKSQIGNLSTNVESLRLNNNSLINEKLLRDINIAIVNDTNAYLKDYREVVNELIEKNVKEFIGIHNDLFENYIFVSDKVDAIIADVKISNIHKLASLSAVEHIDYFENITFEKESCYANPILQTDSSLGLGSSAFNFTDGYDGTGIKIGVIEAKLGKYDATNYNLADAHNNGKLMFIVNPDAPDFVVTDHATKVVSLICGKKTTIDGKTYEGVASGATVIQTCIDDEASLITAINMLLDLDVNVINFSGGKYKAGKYSPFEMYLDLLIEENNVTFINSAGNKTYDYPDKSVSCPGNAYNVITVGNVLIKGTSGVSISSPFPVSTLSCYTNDAFLTNKPDIVAPGGYLFLPSSANSTFCIKSGTSFSAPLITALVAQLMQESIVCIANPNAVKSYLVSGASNETVRETTTAYGELKNESGAGLPNAVNSMNTILNDYIAPCVYSYNSDVGVYKPINYIRIKKGQSIRIALTYNKEEYIPLSNSYGNNVDIQLIHPDGTTVCAESASINNNVEVIEYTSDFTGNYILKARLTNSILSEDGNRDLFTYTSWRIY